MNANFQDKLNRWATGKNIAIFLLLFLLINAAILPWAGARIEAGSGGTGPIDLMFSYSPAEVFEMVDAYGEGRGFYAAIELTVDVLYPAVYSLLFGLLLTKLFRTGFSSTSPLQRVNVFPFIMAGVDFLENAAIVTMLFSHPAQLVFVAQLASLFTTLKWVFFALTLLFVVAGVAALGLGKLRKRNLTKSYDS